MPCCDPEVFRVCYVAVPQSIGAFCFADVRPVRRKWHPAAFGGPVCVWLHGMIESVWLTRSYRIPTLSCPLCCRGLVACFCRVVQTVKAAARTVTLSADPSLVSSALAKGTAFDLRSLKPGMLVETIVDSVLSNGILVSPVQTLTS